MNLSNLKEDDLHVNVQRHCMGRKKETKKSVVRIPKLWQNMRKHSRTDIGRSLGLDQKRSGTEHIRTNRIENGIES